MFSRIETPGGQIDVLITASEYKCWTEFDFRVLRCLNLSLLMAFRALMGSVTGLPVDDVSRLLNRSSVDLLLTGLSDPAKHGARQAQEIQILYTDHLQTSLGWSLSGRTRGSLASRTPAVPIRLYQMLLFTLPGTPVFSAGDEVGLKAGVSTACCLVN